MGAAGRLKTGLDRSVGADRCGLCVMVMPAAFNGGACRRRGFGLDAQSKGDTDALRRCHPWSSNGSSSESTGVCGSNVW